MSRSVFAGFVILAGGAFLAAHGQQGPAKVTPKLDPVAETRLLMEGLAVPNFRSLEKTLRQKPGDADSWAFARGQALLLAETANLLMLRPPKKDGQAQWFDHAMQLRAAAGQLAGNLGKQEYEKSRSALVAVANQCNRCHQTFRVPIEIAPFVDPPPAGEKVGKASGGALDFVTLRQ